MNLVNEKNSRNELSNTLVNTLIYDLIDLLAYFFTIVNANISIVNVSAVFSIVNNSFSIVNETTESSIVNYNIPIVPYPPLTIPLLHEVFIPFLINYKA